MKFSKVLGATIGFVLAAAVASASWGPLINQFPNGGSWFGGSEIVTGSSVTGIQSVQAAATTVIDLSLGNTIDINMGASITTLTVNNCYPGENVRLFLDQSNGGSHTVSWPASARFTGGSAPTLTTTSGKRDSLVFNTDSACVLTEQSRALNE